MKTRLCALGLWLMAFTSQASAHQQTPDSFYLGCLQADARFTDALFVTEQPT